MTNFEDYTQCSPSEYIARTKMDKLGEWATEVEILATARLLGCDVFVYSKYGTRMEWLNYPCSPVLRDTDPKNTDYALYIQNLTTDHYDVVLSVKQFVNGNVQ